MTAANWTEYLGRARQEVLAEALSEFIGSLDAAAILRRTQQERDEIVWKQYLAMELRNDLSANMVQS